MRVTSKGQVTIPKELRARNGIRPGSDVDFVQEPDGIKIRRGKGKTTPGPTRGEKLVNEIRGTATRYRGLSTDDIMKLLRGND